MFAFNMQQEVCSFSGKGASQGATTATEPHFK